MFVRPMASVVLPDSMVVFGAIWAFAIKIASHSGRLSEAQRASCRIGISYVLFEWKAMGAEASINRWF